MATRVRGSEATWDQPSKLNRRRMSALPIAALKQGVVVVSKSDRGSNRPNRKEGSGELTGFATLRPDANGSGTTVRVVREYEITKGKCPRASERATGLGETGTLSAGPHNMAGRHW